MEFLFTNTLQSGQAGKFHPYLPKELPTNRDRVCVGRSTHTACLLFCEGASCRCEYTHGCTSFQWLNKPGASLYCHLSQRADANLNKPFSYLSKRWFKPFHTGRIAFLPKFVVVNQSTNGLYPAFKTYRSTPHCFLCSSIGRFENSLGRATSGGRANN